MTDPPEHPSEPQMPPRRESTARPLLATRRPLRLATLALVTAVGCSAAFLLYARWSRIPLPVAPTTASLDSPYKSEEDWLATRIVEDLWGLATFAANGRPNAAPARITTDAGATGRVTLKITPAQGPALSELLRLEHSVWSPEDYQPLAARLLESQGARPAPAEPPPAAYLDNEESLLRHLLDRRAEIIEDENWAISKALARQPADPRSHENAALLLGAFGLREAPGEFSDVRTTLCRMTAHLALARALRGAAPLSLSGRYAEAVLSTLSDRGAEAEAALARLAVAAPDSQVQEAWRKALQMRMTDDWRLLPHPERASLLEQLEWLRATQLTLPGERGLQILASAGFQPGPEVDWALILAWKPSVGIGNAYLDSGLDALLGEADEIWWRTHEVRLPSAQRIAALNEPAQPFLSAEGPRVIAWGTWAAHYQRHVLLLLKQVETHERKALGLKEAADRTVSERTRAFSGLTLFPALAARWEAEKKNPDAHVLDAAVNLVLRHPELVTGTSWADLVHKTVNQSLPRRLPAAATWFTSACPRGTAYDFEARTYVLLRPGGEPLTKALARLKAISPRNYYVAYYRIFYRYRTPPPAVEAEAELGERVDYDLRAIYWLSEWVYEQDQALLRRLKERMCELDAVKCDQLGALCVDQGDEACALAAYERLTNDAADEVCISNNSDWLLRYYLRRGDRERARDLARRADAVGSAGGFLTMAAFLEATGAYAEAEEHIVAERQRYPREDEPHWDLIGFYHRMAHVRGVRSYEAKFAKLAKDVFPLGVERVELSSFQDPPTDGVLFQTETPALRRNGMHKGDVAVAWDGWRVRNGRQFAAVREFDADPSFKLIIWRSGKYVGVPARRQGRRFGMDSVDYKPKKQ